MEAKKMDILYCGTLPPHMGGSAVLSSHVLIGLTRLGHSVRAVAPITAEKLKCGDTFATQYTKIHVKRIIVPYFTTSPDIPFSKEYQKLEGAQIQEAMSSIISRKRPDIIIIGRESFAWYIPDIAVSHSIPCVLLIQGGTTHGILRRTIPETKAQELLKQFRKVNLIISVAKHLTAPLRQLGFQNLRVIQNTIDTHRFSPGPKNEKMLQELDIQEEDTVIVHISNLKNLKRPMDIVLSARMALKKNRRLKYLIVGDGPLRRKMVEACRQNGISDRFSFLGWIEYPSIPDCINLADIVVMPSEAEGLALVYLEAQASGKLLLASDIPAAQEVIQHGETGLLFQKGDIRDMTSQILMAADSPQLRAEIGRKARLRMENYTLADMVCSYEDALRDTIAQSGEC